MAHRAVVTRPAEPKAKSLTVLSDPLDDSLPPLLNDDGNNAAVAMAVGAYFLPGCLLPLIAREPLPQQWRLARSIVGLAYSTRPQRYNGRRDRVARSIDRTSRIPRPRPPRKKASPSSPPNPLVVFRPTAKSSKISLLDLYRPRPHHPT
jgi:hypothetical protein